MKKSISINHFFSLLFLSTAVLTSCVKKDDYYKKSGAETSRKQVVQITGADDIQQFARDVNPTIDTFALIDIRRYPNTEAELNQPLTVKLTKDATLITNYNNANGTSYVELPSSAYTLLTDINSLTFQPGEAVKEVKIRLNKGTLDLSQPYALAFSISDAGTGAVINTTLKSAIYDIGIKNQWDGVYTVNGTLTDYAVSTITGYYPLTWELRTTGANTVTVYDRDYTGTPTHIISSGGNLSQYGSFGLNVTFDPITNKITSVTNFYGQPAGNGRSAALDPTGVNAYDPLTKTIKIKYYILQPGTTIRTLFDETWQYTGPR